MFPADKLPPVQKGRAYTDAYIANTDPASEPGEHWLAIWTRRGECKSLTAMGYRSPPTRTQSYKLDLSNGTRW